MGRVKETGVNSQGNCVGLTLILHVCLTVLYVSRFNIYIVFNQMTWARPRVLGGPSLDPPLLGSYAVGYLLVKA